MVRRRRAIPARGVLALAAAVAVVLLAVVLWPREEPHPLKGGAAVTHGEAQEGYPSTPATEWRQGSYPHLYQYDPQWKDEPYSGATMETQGCGPTCLAMVYIGLTGKTDRGPVQMAEFSTQNGFSTDNQGSWWTLMSEGAAQLGLTSSGVQTTPEAMTAALEAGRPVVCVVAPGTFTDYGHFMLITGLDSSGKAVVNDPNSEENSAKTWDLKLICDEAEAAWSLWVE